MSVSQHDKEILNRIFSPDLPYKDVFSEDDSTVLEEDESDGSSPLSKQLEIDGVRAAEKGDFAQAIDCFTQAIANAPRAASCFNNRAQALRLKGDVDGALEDLHTAIELSKGKGKVASQALTQRAIVRRFRGQETEALQDFKQAAALGNEFAKRMVIAMNPYAALCNQMMCEILDRECRGQSASM